MPVGVIAYPLLDSTHLFGLLAVPGAKYFRILYEML